MFEQEIERLLDTVREKTIGDGESIALRTILESGIPPALRMFFRAEVESLLASERSAAPRSSRFDYTISDVVMLQEQIDLHLINGFVFTKTEFEAVLDKGVHFLFNYLCRPQWTLLSFLFERGNTIPAEELDLRLRYCRDYPYYGEIVRRYASRNALRELTYDQMKSLLARIDFEVTQGHHGRELADMARPLYDFVAAARGEEGTIVDQTVPVRALMYFFDDKGMTGLSQSLRAERDRGRPEVALPHLVTLLDEALGSGAGAPLSPEPNPGMEPEERPAASAAPPKPLGPLFTIEEERAIIKTVFRHDEEAFRAIVEDALGAGSWDDAALVVDHYFTMNDVEPFTREAVLLTNALQSRFAEIARQ